MKKMVMIFTMLAALMFFPFTSFSDLDDWVPIIPQYQAISIRGTRSGDTMAETKIEPFKKVFVNRRTRVYWSNYSDVPIRIKFGKGENCKDISRVPQRSQYWRLSKQCYITEQPIPQDGALQIMFDEHGTYNYEIQFVGTKSTETGELIVF